VLELADQNPSNTAQILDVYKNASYPKVGAGNTNYNREHTWPSSYGFPNDGSTNYPYSDCHHLFLVDDSYNSSRGNNPFRNCSSGCSELVTLVNNGDGGGSGIYPGNSNWRTGAGATGTWETWVDRRGDVARALMYMDVRYEGGTHGITGAAEPNLILTDNEAQIASSSTGNNLSTAYMGMLSVLLQWHAADPVDAKEMARNDVVYQYQGNRNPFIDHPEWAQCLFASQCNTPDLTPPAAPTAVSAVPQGTAIVVDWANNSESDIAGYDVYRSSASAGPYIKRNTTLLTVSVYNDSTARAGINYFYKIQARDAANNLSAFSAVVSATLPPPPQGPVVWINELHYDNVGADQHEGLEIAGPSNLSLDGWSVCSYDGLTGAWVATLRLHGTLPNLENGKGVLWFAFPELGNGPDGIALVDKTGAVRQFLSYEGSFTAGQGPAAGLASTPLPVSELSTTPLGYSLRVTGSGNDAADFVWQAAAQHSRGKVNAGQALQP
jgi:endonuclease I